MTSSSSGWRRFCRAARHYEQDAEDPRLADFLAQAALSSGEGDEPARSLVTLSTLHGAKGAEWNHVRIAGVCEGLLPHRRAIERGELDEERRLAYVGITRARSELTLSCPQRLDGRFTRVSRFVAEAGLAGQGARHPGRGPLAPMWQEFKPKQPRYASLACDV